MKLYHVSPSENNAAISDSGVDPMKSQGKQKVSWLVTDDMLMWAIAHVSARHHVNTNLISVWVVEAEKFHLKNTKWRDRVYTCAHVLRPVFVFSAVEAINQRALEAQGSAGDYEPSDN